LSDSSSISPDQPELRLLAQLAGVKASALADAHNDPIHFSKHLRGDDFQRYLEATARLTKLIGRMQNIENAEADRVIRSNPALRAKLKAKGLLTNAR
jgi:hypothetical protein